MARRDITAKNGSGYYSAKKRFLKFLFTCKRCGAQSVKNDWRGTKKYCKKCRAEINKERARENARNRV